MPQIVFEVPNLDDSTTDPKVLADLANVFRDLAQYTSMKARAMHLRLKGKISEASILEMHCEQVYKDLPTWARW